MRAEINKTKDQLTHSKLQANQQKECNQILQKAQDDLLLRQDKEHANSLDHNKQMSRLTVKLHACDEDRNVLEREIQCAKDAGRRLLEQKENQREECLALKQYIETLDTQNDDL